MLPSPVRVLLRRGARSFTRHPADTMKGPSGEAGDRDHRVEYGVATEEDQEELFQLLHSVFRGSEEVLVATAGR